MVANNLISLGLWCKLTLLANKPAELKKVQKIINNFVWGGSIATARNRVQLDLVAMPRLKGGLGLISVVTQARALCLQNILMGISEWVTSTPIHYSQANLPFFGCYDTSATLIILNSSLHYNHLSVVLGCMCQAWNSMHKYISLQAPAAKEIQILPIWNCPISTVHQLSLTPSSNLADTLISSGITRVFQLWDLDAGRWKNFEELVGWTPTLRQAIGFRTIIEALIPVPFFRPTQSAALKVLVEPNSPARIVVKRPNRSPQSYQFSPSLGPLCLPEGCSRMITSTTDLWGADFIEPQPK